MKTRLRKKKFKARTRLSGLDIKSIVIVARACLGKANALLGFIALVLCIKLIKFSTVMTSPGSAFQECTGSCHENVPAPKAVSSVLRSTDGLTVLAWIDIVAILVHYQPSYNTSHTQ